MLLVCDGARDQNNFKFLTLPPITSRRSSLLRLTSCKVSLAILIYEGITYFWIVFRYATDSTSSLFENTLSDVHKNQKNNKNIKEILSLFS